MTQTLMVFFQANKPIVDLGEPFVDKLRVTLATDVPIFTRFSYQHRFTAFESPVFNCGSIPLVKG